MRFLDWVPSAASNIPFVIKTGGPDGPFDWFLEPAQVERLLQTHPNFLGLVIGEMTWSYYDVYCTNKNSKECNGKGEVTKQTDLLWLNRVIQVCDKYASLTRCDCDLLTPSIRPKTTTLPHSTTPVFLNSFTSKYLLMLGFG